MSTEVSNINKIVQAVPPSSPFDKLRHFRDDGSEFWTAREMMDKLGYTEWRNMMTVIRRAQLACKNTGYAVSEHFVGANKPVQFGQGGKTTQDYELTRYAAYLTALNGDPRKEEVAEAQLYFTMMTRLAEINNLGPQATPVPVPVPVPVLDQNLVKLQEDQAKFAEKLVLMVEVIDVISGINNEVNALKQAHTADISEMKQAFAAEIDAMNDKFAALGRALGGPIDGAVPVADLDTPALFAPDQPAKLKLRVKVNTIVRQLAEIMDVSYKVAWNVSYKDLCDRYAFDAVRRGRNSGLRPLDVVERENRMGDLHKVVSELYRQAYKARVERDRDVDDDDPSS